ncbi:serine/threonine-protein phosphatase 6 regulatory ankyrin repeat subunit B-like [Gigantopelta aegis]|uniref:serine/threonine-protein phosphatase 6 regulatory ankyrin repeat subunit B-like n=1 Tax=Gigantopelta aegis TaxID=1735272 RepID=UPI001B887B3B|nr:serine/threonine-protein phosphatase 6 regulatory ankyrin repeat subunit B-like [Gigantopelta aegis]
MAAEDAENRDFVHKLRKAIGHCDETTVQRLIKGGVNVNGRYWYDSTLLHEAITVNSLPIVCTLIKAGADVRAVNQDQRTPLHMASRSGRLDLVKELVKAGARVNGQTLDGKTSLHVAVWRGHVQVVLCLVKAGANVNLQDSDGWTPLCWAARLNYLKVAKILIDHGAYINYKSKCDRTPLREAFQYSHLAMARFLILEGADVNLKPDDCSFPKLLVQINTLSPPIIEEHLNTLVSAGYKFHKDLWVKTCTATPDEKPARKLVSTPETNIKVFKEWYENHRDVFPKLSCTCRTRIRRRLGYCVQGKSISAAVKRLELPQIITDFLLFKGEIREIDSS